MTKGAFGEHLKREREMRGVSLEEIAAATRIGTRFLEALENEQWERLPGGVFNRGFVRAVAHFLGLDEESLVAEYALAASDRQEVAVWAKSSPVPGSGKRWLLGLLMLLLIVGAVGGWVAWRRHILGRVFRRSVPTGSLPVAAQSPGAAPASAPAAAQPAPTEAPSTTAGPSGQAEQSAMSPTSAAADEPLTLELTVAAGKTTQVSVVADGKNAFEGKMTAGENQHFQGRERFEVAASNSSALLLELNGQTVPPIGPPGRPGKITLTRKDLKKPRGGPD